MKVKEYHMGQSRENSTDNKITPNSKELLNLTDNCIKQSATEFNEINPQVIPDPASFSPIYHSGVTDEFQTLKLKQNNLDAKETETHQDETQNESFILNQPQIYSESKGINSNNQENFVNPSLKDFNRRCGLQKCSSAKNILRAPFNNRISLSPIHNSQKQAKEIIKPDPIAIESGQKREGLNLSVNSVEENDEVSECSSSSPISYSNLQTIKSSNLIFNINKNCNSTNQASNLDAPKRISFKSNTQLIAPNNMSISMTEGFKLMSSNETNLNVSCASLKCNTVSHSGFLSCLPQTSYTSSFVLLSRDNHKNDAFKSPKCDESAEFIAERKVINSKTPKTIKKRGRVVEPNRQVFGTPDYLSPELLLDEPHDESVDWWALGVCFYEFLVGITPFADSTPQLIFDNILNRVVEWPEGEEALSPNAVNVIIGLLNPEPKQRMNLSQLKQHELFKNVNWNNLLNEQTPFIPKPDHNMDTCYFETRNEIQNIKMDDFNTK